MMNPERDAAHDERLRNTTRKTSARVQAQRRPAPPVMPPLPQAPHTRNRATLGSLMIQRRRFPTQLSYVN